MKSTPRKKASEPVIAQWGDGPLLQIERRRLSPFTAEEFWRICKKYLPAELQDAAAAFVFDLHGNAQRAETPHGPGRPPGGVGSRVEELIIGLKLDQRTARRFVAAQVCTCGDDRERCACGAYERVKSLHNQWRRDQRKGK
ncbi:hypothetical protein EI171_20280 [Bradyrhizobium sp. LCT2]|uniref:hypothetical protein n=1 Tax=Bradyrhizobium sp. LCT2 TaxID=2493093 RepID=UPI0013740CF1|nr:hypothetical protein [Bradyrhizobium sp. LCT2]QHP69418.1 hypothetical protein EI171_20280 [Bradyrhizobium sp. LCT2]